MHYKHGKPKRMAIRLKAICAELKRYKGDANLNSLTRGLIRDGRELLSIARERILEKGE